MLSVPERVILQGRTRHLQLLFLDTSTRILIHLFTVDADVAETVKMMRVRVNILVMVYPVRVHVECGASRNSSTIRKYEVLEDFAARVD